MYIGHRPYVRASISEALEGYTQVSVNFLSGPIVTLNDILNSDELADSGSTLEDYVYYRYSDLMGRLNDLGLTLLSRMYVDALDVSDSKFKDILKFNFSKVSEYPTTQYIEGTATQCIIGFHNTSNIDSSTMYTFMLLNVGAVGSGEDIELLDTEIKSGVPIYLSDLTLNLT